MKNPYDALIHAIPGDRLYLNVSVMAIQFEPIKPEAGMNGLTIGRLAKKAGLGIETVRFYERQGLIPPPARTGSNYRIYAEEEVARLKFIKRAKTLGFTLNEIKELLTLRHDPHTTRADIKERTLAKLADVNRKIQDLARIKAALEHLVSECDGHGPLKGCPILAALNSSNDGCGHAA